MLSPTQMPARQKQQENKQGAQKKAVVHVHSYVGEALFCDVADNSDAHGAERENRHENEEPGFIGQIFEVEPQLQQLLAADALTLPDEHFISSDLDKNGFDRSVCFLPFFFGGFEIERKVWLEQGGYHRGYQHQFPDVPAGLQGLHDDHLAGLVQVRIGKGRRDQDFIAGFQFADQEVFGLLVVVPRLARNYAAAHGDLYEILNLLLDFQAKLLFDQAFENVAGKRAAEKILEILFLPQQPLRIVGEKGGGLSKARLGFCGLFICKGFHGLLAGGRGRSVGFEADLGLAHHLERSVELFNKTGDDSFVEIVNDGGLPDRLLPFLRGGLLVFYQEIMFCLYVPVRNIAQPVPGVFDDERGTYQDGYSNT